MTEERTVWTEGKPHIVVLSDEREALLAAQAAGRAVVGVESWGTEYGRAAAGAESWGTESGRAAAGAESWGIEFGMTAAGAESRSTSSGQAAAGAESQGTESGRVRDILPVRYVVETRAAADHAYLERVLRRHLGLPWIITETERLIVREFTVSDAADAAQEEGGNEADRIFYTPELLESYIRCQYGFYEYGIWALTDRESGRLIGKAGVTAAGRKFDREESAAEEALNLELGYHIFTPYRGRGYAKESCRGILDMLTGACARGAGCALTVWARTDAGNMASIRVLESCGFTKKSTDTTEQIDFWRNIRYNER